MLRNWQAGQTITKLLTTIMELLKTPNTDDALEAAVAEQYKTNKGEFDRIAAEWTKAHA